LVDLWRLTGAFSRSGEPLPFLGAGGFGGFDYLRELNLVDLHIVPPWYVLTAK
jgi:hypothetical protein